MSSTTGTFLFFPRLLLLSRLEGVSDGIRGFFALVSGAERSPPCSKECVLFLLSGVTPEDIVAEREGLSHDHVTSPLLPRPHSHVSEYLNCTLVWIPTVPSSLSPTIFTLFSLGKHMMSFFLPLAILSFSAVAAPVPGSVRHSDPISHPRPKLILSTLGAPLRPRR